MAFWGSVGVVVAFAVLFFCVGRRLLDFVMQGRYPHPAFRNGFGFYIGLIAFVAAWRLLTCLSHQLVSAFAVVVAGFLLILLLDLKSHRFRPDFLADMRISPGTVGFIVVVLVLVPLLMATLWLPALPARITPFHALGTAETGRYLNILLTILRLQDIPVLGQSYGQSLLGVIPMLFGMKSPALGLAVWLNTAMIAFVLCIYGVFRTWGLSPGAAKCATFLVLFGNTALSLLVVVAVDTWNPLITNGNLDSLVAIVSFLWFVLLLKLAWEKQLGLPQLGFSALLLGLAWSISGAQMILLALGLLGGLLLWSFISRSEQGGRKRVAGFAGLLLVFSVLGVLQGGILTPRVLWDASPIPGLKSIEQLSVSISPSLPHFYVFTQDGVEGGKTYTRLKRDVSASWVGIVATVEENAWLVLKTAFFPLLGLGIVLFRARRQAATSEQVWFARVGAFVLLAGLVVVFPFSVAGMKWELTRFLLAGYTMGLMVFAWVLVQAGFQRQPLRQALAVLVALLMTGGPLAFYAFHFFREGLYRPGVLSQRIERVMKVSSIVEMAEIPAKTGQ